MRGREASASAMGVISDSVSVSSLCRDKASAKARADGEPVLMLPVSYLARPSVSPLSSYICYYDIDTLSTKPVLK